MKRININGRDYTDFAEALAAVYDHINAKDGQDTDTLGEAAKNGHCEEQLAEEEKWRKDMLAFLLRKHSFVMKFRDAEALPGYIVVLGKHKSYTNLCKAVLEHRMGTQYTLNPDTLQVDVNYELSEVGMTEREGVLGVVYRAFDGAYGYHELVESSQTPFIVVNYYDFDEMIEKGRQEWECQREHCSGCCGSSCEEMTLLDVILRFLSL